MSSPDQDKHLLDQLQITLQELSKAAENIVYLQQTLASLRQIDLRESYAKITKLLSSTQALEHLKHIDLDQISALLQSPLIREILTDPEFYQLFAPDSGNTIESYNKHESGEKNKD